MALNTLPTYPTYAPAAQAKPGSPKPDMTKPGTMFAVDDFSAPDSHGNSVVQAARQGGFRGPVVELQENTSDKVFLSGRAQKDMQAMDQPDVPADTFTKKLKDYDTTQEVGLLNLATDGLQQVENKGGNQGSTNLSLGTSKASIVKGEYDQIMDGYQMDSPPSGARVTPMGIQTTPPSDEQMQAYNAKERAKQQLTANAINAFGLDGVKLGNPDPTISGPQRAKLQQGLINQANQAIDGNTEIQAAKGKYNQAIDTLADRHESVNVASGNEGTDQHDLEALDAPPAQNTKPGAPQPKTPKLTVPADFDVNVLSSPKARMIGAVGVLPANPWAPGPDPNSATTVAPYTSSNPGMTRFGPGVLVTPDNASDGTSIATPYNAALDTAVLGSNPKMSIEQANDFEQKSFTKQIPNNGHPVSELDMTKVTAYEQTHDAPPAN